MDIKVVYKKAYTGEERKNWKSKKEALWKTTEINWPWELIPHKGSSLMHPTSNEKYRVVEVDFGHFTGKVTVTAVFVEDLEWY